MYIFLTNLQKNIHFIIFFHIFVPVKIHIFNPENDMALADGTPGYTPPANIRAYRKDNWQLPKQWADAEDIVWDGETEFRNLGISEHQKIEICPWGWSKALVHQLELAGIPREMMPTDKYLDKLRSLSSRVSTVKVQQQLGIDTHVCTDMEGVEKGIEEFGRVVMKSPWSSSGKGLMTTDNPNWQGWVKRILKLQGAVIVERLLDKQQDFAMEFWMKDGKAEYLGLSIFNTDAYGHYLNNVSGAEEEKGLRNRGLETIRSFYIANLPIIAPWYRGPVGVDMLITKDGEICPCIEINWRMTMGIVALKRQNGLEA